jgi:hypothetical protein
MKKLLLSISFLLNGVLLFAQGGTACTATTATTGTQTCAAFPSTSTYKTGCLGSASTGTKAAWYKYTPTVNGELTVSSNLATNNGVAFINDTRVSIFKIASATATVPSPTCLDLTCVDYNDDVSSTNYKSSVTFPVKANVTYYIQWDNIWYTAPEPTTTIAGFQFSLTFTTPTCIRPGKLNFYLPDTYTTTSAKLYWDQAIGAPTNYDIDSSPNFATAAGAGTIVTSAAGAATYAIGTLSGITSSSNFRYYVRSNCGGTQSAWVGPNYGYLAKVLPYTNTFDNVNNNYTDGFIGFTRFTSTSTSNTNPPNYADSVDGLGTSMYTYNDVATSNLWAYSRAVSLVAGEQVTIKFKTRLYGTAPMTLALKVGTEQRSTLQTTAIQTFNVTDATAYTQQTATWTATTPGIYYFGFNNNSAASASQSFLFLDTLELTSVLSTTEFIDSNFSISPNPANDFITVSNADNISVNAISITDLNGRVVKQNTYSNVTNVQVNVSDLASGVYMMSISSDKASVTKKIIKN